MRILGAEKIEETPTYVLEMVPKSERVQAYFGKIVLWIDGRRWIPIQQKLVEPSDDYLLVRFREIKMNPALTAADFKLKLPKGTRLVGWKLKQVPTSQESKDRTVGGEPTGKRVRAV